MISLKRICFSIFIMLCSINATNAAQPLHSIRIIRPSNSGPVAQRASELLAREITERSNVSINPKNIAVFTIELAIKPGIGAEGFTIADNGSNSVKITGNDENGLLYGVGKFLHTSAYCPTGFTPGTWRGTSVPKCPLRGMHLDTHFMNYYEASNDSERKRYIEDLALWGINNLIVLFPSPWLTGFDDPKATEALRRMNQMMMDAKAVGMTVGIAFGNDMGFSTFPREYAATPAAKCWGPVIMCPVKPKAMQYMEDNLQKLLDKLSGPGVDFVLYWPYDEGGCNCKDCAPWGSNGFPRMCQKFTSVVRAKYPKSKFILSTWFFDNDKDGSKVIDLGVKNDGEYAGLDKFLKKDKSWVDYLMVDGHDNFPEYPLKVGVPGNLPMVNFPEISMWGTDPIWGGFGANPMPKRFQAIWDQAKDKLSGGIPYSEGIWEDMNKVFFAQFYWEPNRSSFDILKEYISYEFSPEVVEKVSRVVEILEQNLPRRIINSKVMPDPGEWHLNGAYIEGSRFEFCTADLTPLSGQAKEKLKQTTEEAYQLMGQVDAKLTSHARASWRWRILYLRTIVDRELVRNKGWFEGPVLKAAFDELTRIYHSENAARCVHVPRIDDADAKYSEQSNKQ